MGEDLLQSIGQDFRDDFIYDITKANGPKSEIFSGDLILGIRTI